MRWLSLAGLLITTAVSAAEPALAFWPAWRGPLANGTAPEAHPPIHWDATTNVRWKAPLEGRGSATPIVWGDRVFVLSAAATDKPGEPPELKSALDKRTQAPSVVYEFIVTCLDRNTGAVLWRKIAAEKVPHEGHHQTHSYAAGSPATDGTSLVASFGSFGVFCYDLDGHLKWKRELGLIQSRLGWGEAVTPVIHGDSVVLNWDGEADSSLVCLDIRSGEIRWRTPRNERSSWNTPSIVTHGGTTQVVVNATSRIRGYDLASGQELWQCGGMTVNAIPSVVASGNVVYAMSGYQGSAARAIRIDGRGDLTNSDRVVWKHNRGTPYVPSPLLLDGRLWFTQANGNMLTVLDAATGKPVMDRERLPGVTSFYASPAAAAGRVYFVDRSGTTLVLKAGDRLDVLATNKLDDPVDASPVLAGKQLFLRGTKFIYCIEEKSGN